MTELLQYLAPLATTCAAIIAALASWKVRQQADKSEAMNREYQLYIAEMNREYQFRIAELNNILSHASKQAHERYSLKAKVLVEMYKLAGETCYYLERFLVPYTNHEPMPKDQLIAKAEESFESLVKFHFENTLFLVQGGNVASALSEMMGGINIIRNSEPENGSFSEQQARQFISKVRPALEEIRKEFEAELQKIEF